MRKIALSLTALGVCLILAEIVYRVDYAADVERVLGERDPADLVTEPAGGGLLYRYRPSLPGVTNAHGFRDRERSLAKPAGHFRIAAVGDSVTSQMSIPFEKLYATRLQHALDDTLPHVTVEVLNFGITGYSAYQEAELLEREVLDFEPDALLWQFHDNDAADPVLFGANGGLGIYYARPTSYLWRFLRRRVTHLRERWFLSVPRGSLPGELRLQIFYWERMGRTFREVRELAIERGIPVFLFLYPAWPVDDDWSNRGDAVTELRQRLVARFENLGFTTLDLEPGLRRVPPGHYRMAPDDPWHPNQRGHAWIAQRLLEWMAPRLESSIRGATPPERAPIAPGSTGSAPR